MRIYRNAPLDRFPKILQTLVDVEEGVDCISNIVFMAHGANDIAIPSAIYLSVSHVESTQAPKHVASSGIVLYIASIWEQTQYILSCSTVMYGALP